MRRLKLLLWLAALWVAAGQTSPPTDEQELFGEVDRLMAQLSRISGMPVRHGVASGFITRSKVNEFLKQRVKEVATPAEVRAEELTLKAFGLVPVDFDLPRSTVDLLTEQAAAFYDFRRKKLFITESTPSETQEAALVHELAHALADQNFNLARFLKKAGKSDDGANARMAVMEGQATWLMCEFLARKTGQSLEKSPSLAESMSRATETMAGQYPVFAGAPLYMRVTLVFPYTKGMQFQQAVVERDGKAAFAEVFRRPPMSTQQILQPERYFENTPPAVPEPPGFHQHGYKELASGSFGELDHAILLEQYGGKEEAAALAPHWRGGQYRLYEQKNGGHLVLAYASQWDTPAAAARFFRFYRKVLKHKWKKLELASETADTLAGTGDAGPFRMECRDTLFTSLEGGVPPDPAVH